MRDDRKTKKQLLTELRELRSKLRSCHTNCGEMRYRAMFEHMASGFVVYDVVDGGQDFVVREFNPAAERLNDIPVQDAVGHRLSELFPLIKDSEARRAMRRVWRTGRSERVPAQQFEGAPGDTWREYVVYRLPSGQVAVIVDDVTAREQAAREARSKAEFLQATLDAVNDGIWEYDLARERFSCSERLAGMLGCTASQAACHGPLCRELLHPDDVTRLDAALDRCRLGASDRVGLELRMRPPGQDWKWFYARGSVVERSETGRATRIIGAHTDLTEHKRAQQRLRESLELFSSIFENAYTTMMLIDPADGRIVEANARACGFYGYSPAVLKSMTIMDLNILPPQEVRQVMRRAGDQAQSQFRFRHRLASGEVRDVEVHTGPVHIHGRALLYSIVHDVTERLRAEEALRRSEATLSSIFRAAPVGIGTVRERVLGTVNQALCAMLGYTPGELTGNSSRMLYATEEEFLRVGREYNRQVNRHGHGTVETIFRARDGEPRNVLLGSSWLDPADHDQGLVFTVLDVTERRRAQEEISRVRKGLHQLADSMPSALFVVDQQARVTLCNEAAQELVGGSEAEMAGRTFHGLLPGFAGFASLLDETLASGGPLMRKALPRSVDGRLRFWDLLVYPLDEGGPGRAVVRLDDVSDRVQMEEAMIQNEKMMSVGGLAAGMAHEINNPLAGILQGAQNIRRRLDPALEANRRVAAETGCDMDAVAAYAEARRIARFLEGISAAGERAAQIVSNMLDFSRDGHSLREPLDLAQCIQRSVGLAAGGYDLGRRYDFRHIEVLREFEKPGPVVHGSMPELQQVFLNLLINAAHAMADKIYEDEPPRLILRCRTEGGQAVAEVQDNGPGIDDALRGRIFDPFFTTKAPGQGTGLGLSVSYFIVTRNHGGSITVQSEPGLFTRFTIRLPLVRDEDAKKAPGGAL